MKAIFRFIAANNFLPIVNTYICFSYFSKITGGDKRLEFFAFGAALACWLFYYIDKLKDNKDRIFHSDDRHFLSKTDKTIQWTIGIILTLLTLYNFSPFYITELGLPLIIFITGMAYLKVADSPEKTAKELVSSLMITTAVGLIPIQFQHGTRDYWPCIVFFMMIYGNMAALSIIDKEYDSTYNFSSMAAKSGTRTTALVFTFTAVIALTTAFFMARSAMFIWVMVWLLFHALALLIYKKTDHNLLHIITDLAFLYPLSRL